jgi:hypothetical protein
MTLAERYITKTRGYPRTERGHMVSKLGAKWACAAVFVWVACSGFANAQGSLFNEKGALLFDDRNLNSKDLPNMVSTYHENEMRFKRDFVGKRFLDVLPFRSATENMFLKGMYTVGFGTGSLVSDVDCTITSPAAIDRIADWNKGDLIHIEGIVTDVTMESVNLDPCHLYR